jgi:hypothetical protein
MKWRWVCTTERPEYWQWVSERSQASWEPGSKGLVAVRSDGVVGAGVLADSWTFTSCTCHIAVENPMAVRAGFLKEVARYLFDFCDRKIIVGLTPADNERALRFNRKIGWQEVCRIPEGWKPGVDFVVQTMTPEQCRYYEVKADG